MRQLGFLMIAFSLLGCEKPKLRTDNTNTSPEESSSQSAKKSYLELRMSVIGKSFATLTLGSRKFTQAEVREITDEEIVIAHAGGVDKVPWSEVSSTVRKQWGYHPDAKPVPDKLAATPTETKAPPEERAPKEQARTEIPPAQKPIADPKERKLEIARKQRMLAAQLVGIQNMESDFSRHSQTLNDLKRQLQALQAQQKRPRSKGVIVKRIGGQSTLMNQDRSGEIRAVQAKIKGQEQFVAQLLKSLQGMRKQHQDLKLALDRMR